MLLSALQSLEEHAERGRPGPAANLRALVIPFGSGAYVAQYRTGDDEVVVARIFHSREFR